MGLWCRLLVVHIKNDRYYEKKAMTSRSFDPKLVGFDYLARVAPSFFAGVVKKIRRTGVGNKIESHSLTREREHKRNFREKLVSPS